MVITMKKCEGGSIIAKVSVTVRSLLHYYIILMFRLRSLHSDQVIGETRVDTHVLKQTEGKWV